MPFLSVLLVDFHVTICKLVRFCTDRCKPRTNLNAPESLSLLHEFTLTFLFSKAQLLISTNFTFLGFVEFFSGSIISPEVLGEGSSRGDPRNAWKRDHRIPGYKKTDLKSSKLSDFGLFYSFSRIFTKCICRSAFKSQTHRLHIRVPAGCPLPCRSSPMMPGTRPGVHPRRFRPDRPSAFRSSPG